MSPTALVIDEDALNALSSAIIDDSWFQTFHLPSGARGIKRVQVKSTIYLLSAAATENSRFLVVRVGEKGLFSKAKSPRHLFDRLVHAALAMFDRTISIPVGYRPFHEGSRLSIYAQPESQGKRQRLYLDTNPGGTKHIYAYALTSETEPFNKVAYDSASFDEAYGNVVDALLTQPQANSDEENFGIVLTEPLGVLLLGSATLNEWYEKKLTRQQRDFVNRGHLAPVRLKGSAGTGKTVALAVKCLRDSYDLDLRGEDARVAFITHSSALAHDVVRGMFYALDPKERWRNLRHAQIWLGSLYELAQELLQYEQKNLRPLSTDGREGREWQFDLINDAIDRCLSNTKFVVRDLDNCEPYLRSALKSTDRTRLVAELMNEFACVIDAEGIMKGTAAADRYLKAPREIWQMNLPTQNERRIVLDIHQEYCRELESSGTLSMDQMIADLNRYLLTHEWRQLREQKGFDLIFVDELHYFNRAERMTLHSLFRSRAIKNGKCPLFMAYDLKQSATDAFLAGLAGETGSSLFRSIGAGETDLVELTEVFRSTPEIAAFLRDLDGSFPALGLGEEWGDYSSISQKDRGEVPTLNVYAQNLELLDEVFKAAERAARIKGGRQVAVLCLNDELFSRYLTVGRIDGKYVPITSRDQIGELKYAGKRSVFSMPEYVAGLQFDTVFLIHLDEVEIAGKEVSSGARRRFISRCYLGASRAAVSLHVASSNERSGPAGILDGPLKAGSLKQL